MSRSESLTRTTAPSALAPVAIGQQGLEIKSFQELKEFAQFVLESPFKPKGFDNVGAIAIAIQFGMELGLAPLQAMQNICVINGKPSIYGDAALAVVRASGLLEYIEEKFVGDGEHRKAVCILKRRGARAERVTEFGYLDARRAGLLSKDGPWKQYPDRMMMFRARSWGLRDEFGDVLKGMITAEEAMDIADEGEKPVGPAAGPAPSPTASRVAQLKDRIKTAKDGAAPAPEPAREPETIDAADLGVVVDVVPTDEPRGVEYISDDQLKQLESMMMDARFDLNQVGLFCEQFGIEAVKLLPAVNFDDAHEYVKNTAAELAEVDAEIDAQRRKAAELRDLVEQSGLDAKALLKQFKKPAFEDLDDEQMAKVRQIAEARLGKGK